MFNTIKYFVLICFSLLLIACGGAEDRKLKYITEAQERFEARDFEKAKLGFKNAIQIDPKDPEPRIGLAKVLVAEKNWRAAAGQYKGALQADPENNVAAVELGKLLLLARGIKEAEEQAEDVLARVPGHIGGLTLKAAVLAHQGKADESYEILEQVSSRNPENADAALLFSTALRNKGNDTEALAVLDKAIELNPKSNDLLSMKALVFDSIGEQTQAKNIYFDLIEKNPDQFSFKQRYVAYLLKIGEQDEAEQTLQGFVKEDDENIEARKILVDMLVSQKKANQAAKLLGEYIAEYPEEYDFQMGLARLKLLEEDKDSAIAILEKIKSEDPEGPSAASAELELAKIDLREGSVESVKARLDELLAIHSTNTEALMLRGTIAMQEGRNVDAVNDFRSVLASDPDDAVVVRALSKAHLQAKEYELAENYLKQLVFRFPKDIESRDNLAKLFQVKGEFTKAINLRKDIETISPTNLANLIEMAKLHVSAGDMDNMLKVAEKLKSNESVAASGHYFAALYHQSKNEHERAVVSLDQALMLTPNAIEPLSAKVKSLIVLEKREQAKEFLKSLVSEGVNESLAHNLLGELYLFEKDYSNARTHLELSIDLNKDWVVPHKNLALSYKQEGKVDQAIDALKDSLVMIPSASILRVDLAQLYEATQQFDDAINQYEILTESANAPLFAANNLAMLLVTYRDDEQSLKKARKVAEVLRGQENPNFLDTLGWVYYKNAQYDLALPLIKAAAEKSPDNPQITYHLAKAFNAKQDAANAKLYFEKALSSERSFVGRQDAEAVLKSLSENG